MNKFEKMLREQLEEYLEKGDTMGSKEVLEASREAEYIYEVFPLWNGGMNAEGKYENIHFLRSKGAIGIEVEGDVIKTKPNKITATMKKVMWFATKEVIETKLEMLLYDLQLNKITEFKNEIIKLFNEYTNRKIIEVLPSMIHPKNCVKCIHWNYGRRYWICLKDHHIIKEDKVPVELVALSKTSAYKCEDYEVRSKKECMDLFEKEEE
jgi:hypothetical protein